MKAKETSEQQADDSSRALTGEQAARLLRQLQRTTREFTTAQRIVKAMCRCSDAAASETEELPFLTEVCKAVVDLGGYRMAWVGFAQDDEAKSVRPEAWAGAEDGYLKAIRISWGDNEFGRGPTGTAIRLGEPCTMGSIPVSTPFAPWRAEAVARGYQSSVAIPLLAKGHAAGALNIYSGVEAFSEDEVEMLSALAKVVTNGLTAICKAG
ncbi:MAG: GAF domain-containing protein [Phycisphaerae bacterium]